ncbi:HTH-like domain-containing protein [Shewanella algae]|uniref:HTH-like domain-containing protein n=1 Tax=Shewanella algae TaxID=38313 RepID=UPI0031F5C3AE
MNANDLAKKLNEMYFGAIDGETATMVHLFGIKYSDEIKACEASPKQIAILAKIPETYGTEINKACKLSKYVVIK